MICLTLNVLIHSLELRRSCIHIILLTHHRLMHLLVLGHHILLLRDHVVCLHLLLVLLLHHHLLSHSHLLLLIVRRMAHSLGLNGTIHQITADDRCWLPHAIFGLDLSLLLRLICHGKSHVHQFSLGLLHLLARMSTFGKIEAHLTFSVIISHGVLNLFLQFFLHLNSGTSLISWVEDAHCLKVKGTNRPHEHFLQVLLHHVLISLHFVLTCLSISESISQRFNLFLVSGRDGLQLSLHLSIEFLLIKLDFGNFEILMPSLEDLPHSLDSKGSCFVGKYSLGVFFEVPISLESLEASHLANLHSCNSLALSRPKRHDFRSETIFLALFRFLSQLLLQIFYFTLLGPKKSIAPPPLGITSLLLLIIESTFGSNELLHSLSSEVDNQLV